MTNLLTDSETREALTKISELRGIVWKHLSDEEQEESIASPVWCLPKG